MDPNCGGIPLPLLRFNKDDEGVEEVSLLQMISDIWPEPPHNHRIQFFVTYDREFLFTVPHDGVIHKFLILFYSSLGVQRTPGKVGCCATCLLYLLGEES